MTSYVQFVLWRKRTRNSWKAAEIAYIYYTEHGSLDVTSDRAHGFLHGSSFERESRLVGRQTCPRDMPERKGGLGCTQLAVPQT